VFIVSKLLHTFVRFTAINSSCTVPWLQLQNELSPLLLNMVDKKENAFSQLVQYVTFGQNTGTRGVLTVVQQRHISDSKALFLS